MAHNDMGKHQPAIDFPEIQTPRLVLRVLTMNDAPAVYRHFSDDDVTRFMVDTPSCQRIEDAEEIILFHERDSGCRWGLFEKAADVLIGTCGYHCWATTPPAKAEIGYDLAKAHWGRGLMQEALQSVIGFGFDVMQLQRIEASVHPENIRSIRLLRRLGFRQDPTPGDELLWFHLLHTTDR